MATERDRKVATRSIKVLESYRKVFTGPEGEKVLFDLMKNHHVLSSTFSGQTSDRDVFLREGERNVILRIMSILKIDTKQLWERIESNVERT
jgi:hypothetical protein